MKNKKLFSFEDSIIGKITEILQICTWGLSIIAYIVLIYVLLTLK